MQRAQGALRTILECFAFVAAHARLRRWAPQEDGGPFPPLAVIGHAIGPVSPASAAHQYHHPGFAAAGAFSSPPVASAGGAGGGTSPAAAALLPAMQAPLMDRDEAMDESNNVLGNVADSVPPQHPHGAACFMATSP